MECSQDGLPIDASVPPTPSADPSAAVLPGPIRAETPDGPLLLELERRSRREGTGLREADLIGRWRLDQVWGKAHPRPSSFSSALLRGLAARLEITPGDTAHRLRLGNAVNLGALELRFEGDGQLRGRRPLLVFWFERMQLRLGGRLLLERPLPRPQPRRLPFFALIASAHPGQGEGSEGGGVGGEGWLAARGRGGGLALWRLEN
jgi:hypothetical protein